MRKFITMVLISVIATVSSMAQNPEWGSMLDYDKAFAIHEVKTNKALTDEQYMYFIKKDHKDVFDKYHNDEFEWQDQKAKLVEEIENKIKTEGSIEATTKFYVVTRVEFGDYDFSNEGYKVTIKEGTGFPFQRKYIVGDESDSMPYQIVLFLKDFSKYNQIPMAKDKAKEFLQSRKNSRGSINREVLLLIHYTISDFTSNEYKTLASQMNKDQALLYADISSIEIYGEDSKKIGDLIKK